MSELNIEKSFNVNYNNHLKNIIPILIERKYCYTMPNQKGYYDTNGDIQNNPSTSNYNIYGSTVKPPILTLRSGNAPQYDDYLKDNVINSFTDILLSQVSHYANQSVQSSLSNAAANANETLHSHQKNIINDLNQDLNNLSNKKHNNITSYSQKDYNKHKYRFHTNLIINTLFVFSIIFTLHALTTGLVPILPKDLILYVNAIIIGVYTIYLVLTLNASKDRNKTNWKQFNFRNIEVEEKA